VTAFVVILSLERSEKSYSLSVLPNARWLASCEFEIRTVKRRPLFLKTHCFGDDDGQSCGGAFLISEDLRL
jgi:hypothetical protein